jgi:hypothetical protein
MESEKIAFQTKFLPVVRSMHYELTERLGLTNQDVSTTRPEIEKLMQIMAVQLIETGTIAGAHPIANLANYLQDLATRLP